MLSIPAIQDKLATEASRELSKLLNVPVNVGRVEIDWLSRLAVKDISVEDQQGEILLEADLLSAGFKLFPLLQKKWVFTTVRLFGLSLHLKKETPHDKLNMQFLIDAFSSRDTTKSSHIDLQIHSVLIRRSTLDYHVKSIAGGKQKFDLNHITVNNINANIAVKSFNPDSLSAQIKKLSFDEQTGFKLNKLSMSLEGNKDSISLQKLDIILPNSQFHLSEATIWHANKDSLEQLLDKAPIKLEISPSLICLKDFSAFAPVLRNYSDQIQLSALVSGTINDLLLEEFSLKQNGKISFFAKMNLKSITKPDETYVFGQVNNFHMSAGGLTDLINNFQNESIEIPSYLTHLGSLDFNGEISGFLDHLVAYGNLHSNIGSLKMDLLIGQKKEKNIASYFKGQIASSELNLNKLFDEGNPYGIAHFLIDVDISRPVNGSFAGNVNAQINQFDYNQYQYENILLNGHFRKDEFNGVISIDDPNGQLYAEGLFKYSDKNSEFNFFANLTNFRPDKLFLTRKYEQPELNLSLNANFKGSNVDDFEGRITLKDFSFLTSTDSFNLESLHVETIGQELSRKLTVTSDIINGEIVGNYSFHSLLTSFSETAQIYLPSLPIKQKQKYIHDNIFSFIIRIENTENLSNTFKLPFTILEQTQLSCQYNSILNQFNIEASLPKFKVGKSVFESGSILCNNPNGKMQFLTNVTLLHKKGSRNQFNIQADATNDRINTWINFENDQDNKMKIGLQASSLFISEKDELGKEKFRTEITIKPEQIILKDSIWELEPSSIIIADGDISIKNFYLSKNDQYLRINGTASAKDPRETINLDLNDIELSYIFDIVNIPALQFGGRATGTVNLSDLYGNRILNTDLEVQQFSFNQVVQGKLNLFSEWDNDQQGILMLGTIYKNDSTWTDVNGYIYPVGQNAGLSLYFDATDIDLALLNPYVDAFSHVIEGRGYGNIHLFGAFSKLSFEGKAYVQNGRIGVEFLNTDYTFSDSIYIYPTSFQGKDIIIQDKQGNIGSVSFNVNHQFLKNFTFNADIQAQNLLVYDAPERINPQLYGVVYSTGNAHIRGDEQLVDINANLQTDPQTFIGFNFMTESTVEDYDFIIFRDQQENKGTLSNLTTIPTLLKNNSETEIRLNCLIDATPNANFELIVDPVAGDKLRGNGSGNLQVQYGSRTNLGIYGTYTLLNGIYNFSLQQVIHKDFQIREGSRIDFSGDPMMANLNLDASYYLTANIEDLDQALVHETVRTSVPLNCILKLNGQLQNPFISFDLEFPSSSQELERQVKSFIDTEDMMLRQIIYLLVLNKFYTPDYSRNEYRSSELNSVASSALSSQLSGILNSLTDKVQIGANIRSGQEGFTDTEVEMLLSSQLLNNRLIFNGSFGYKNNMGGSTKGNMVQSNAFIGEFDLEYKLTPTGEYRLKAYNHANDMYLYTKSLTRQGVGIMFRKDFTTLRELFQRRKRRLIVAPPDSIQSK